MTLLEYVISQGYETKEAEAFIRAGKVLINQEVIITPSKKIKTTDSIRIKKLKKWVSRGAYKLLDAIDEFNLDFNNKVILDVGSSTGGFTQVVLENGAKKVYSLDVGTNQLDYKLRSNKKVIVLEKTNLKTITNDMFNENIDMVVTDVSFISLKHVFDVCKTLGDNYFKIVALIKPQFEANSDQVQSGGFVPEELHKDIISNIERFANANDFKLMKIKKSIIKGNKSKNQEYISLFER